MRSKRCSPEEQFRLVTECRKSGLSDSQWCLQHDISINTFYNWTSRLRKKGIELPVSALPLPKEQPDIVRVDFSSGTVSPNLIIDVEPITPSKGANHLHPVMELSIGDEISLKISNDVSTSLLASLLVSLKEQLC